MVSNKDLKLMANKLRIHSINETTKAGSGHPTSCMSCAEIMSVLFFSEFGETDEFILSKGHSAPILWAVYAESGIFPRAELKHLRDIHSKLEGHPTKRMPCTKIATGSLGQGLSAGVGMALGKELKKDRGMVYVLLGDGECAEGSVWEAANSANYYSLDNLCAIVDVNRLGQSQATMHGHDVSAYADKFKAFGWNAIVINGHNVHDVKKALRKAGKSKKPFAIIARTLKGKGSKVENKHGFHGKPFEEKDAIETILNIGRTDIELPSRIKHCLRPIYNIKSCKRENYFPGHDVATRTAFGTTLANLGDVNKNIVCVDGDVRNSTKTEAFFEDHPDRSFESFIAEQNMIGMAMGLSALSFVPFVATFGTFLTRAHDFIRMAQYSQVNLNIVGSHTGVSIGEDGPSQMGLEDMSIFMSMPDAVILNPSDAVSTDALTIEMAKNKGIIYLRTIREKTPILYKNTDKFKIGGLRVLKKSPKDKAVVVASGITVHEALKAYEILKKKGIKIRVIDLYSVKPIDAKSLLANCKGKKVIVVEDHYDGGIGGEVAKIVGKISHLYIKEIPRSGKPEELRRKFEIDAEAIIKSIKP